MADGINSGLAHGTSGSPQGALDNEALQQIAKKNEDTVHEEILLHELLLSKGVKISPEKVVFITRDATGQIIWLEEGNSSAGLEHILMRHSSQFNDIGISTENIPDFLKSVITDGSIVSSEITKRKGRNTINRIYDYKGEHYILTGIGTNGFIVSAFPIRKGKIK